MAREQKKGRNDEEEERDGTRTAPYLAKKRAALSPSASTRRESRIQVFRWLEKIREISEYREISFCKKSPRHWPVAFDGMAGHLSAGMP